MAKSARTPAKARAASIARAARLQREAAERGEAPAPTPPRPQAKPRPDRTRTPKGDRPARSRSARQRGERQQEKRPRSLEREAIEQRREAAPVPMTTRLAYNIAAGRRRQHERRVAFNEAREAAKSNLQRFDARRQAERQKAEQQKHAQQDKQRRERVRAEFTKTSQQQRETAERQRHQRQQALQLQERRQDQQRKQEQKRSDQLRGEQRKKDEQKRRDQLRSDLAKAADRRRNHAGRATVEGQHRQHWQQEWQGMTRQRLARHRQAAAAVALARDAQARAGATVDADHKRQNLDQQGAHRFEVADLKSRQTAAVDSFRRNEVLAIERHHAAVQGIDGREKEVLADFDARRSSLTGRIAEAVPGRRAANDQARADMVQSFEAERLTKHRDLEALQERQFVVAQRTRLDHIGERLALQGAHIEQRRDLQHQQKAGRAELVKTGARTIQRLEREQTAENRRAIKGPDRERDRPAPSFGRA